MMNSHRHIACAPRRLALLLSVLLLCGLSPSLFAQGSAPKTDPRAPGWEYFPELGRMEGSLPCHEQYGWDIHPVGDVNNDGLNDWIVQRTRCDTVWGFRKPIELLLYKGVSGGLPAVESGERIGPSEILANTSFLGAGDWDDDGNRDIAVTSWVFGDSSNGNVEGYHIERLIVFWGNEDGVFTIADTSTLTVAGEVWLPVNAGMVGDFDGDDIDDFLVWGKRGLVDGVLIPTPDLHIYRGHRGARWGRDGTPSSPDWQWWRQPTFSKLLPYSVDQDEDGADDIVFYYHDRGLTSGGIISVLYGNPGGGLPDTTDVETVPLAPGNGYFSILSDITGDGVLELLTTTGLEDVVKVYAGVPGQRISEQFGSGDEPPDHSRERWWGKPWAEVWMPHLLDEGYVGAGEVLYQIGDANLDGINDLWGNSSPYVICYSAGPWLDSLVDGMLLVPRGGNLSGVVSLGDIDGSGLPTFVVDYDEIPGSVQNPFPGGLLFFQPTDEIPAVSRPKKTLPHLPSSVVDEPAQLSSAFDFRAAPNPGDDAVALRWDPVSDRAGTIEVTDVLGSRVAELPVSEEAGSVVWHPGALVGGYYFLTLRFDSSSETLRLLIR